MAKLVLVCGVRLAAGAWQLCEERREFGTGTSLRAASTRGRAQCPAPRHGRPRGGRPSPLGHPLYTEPARDKVGLVRMPRSVAGDQQARPVGETIPRARNRLDRLNRLECSSTKLAYSSRTTAASAGSTVTPAGSRGRSGSSL